MEQMEGSHPEAPNMTVMPQVLSAIADLVVQKSTNPSPTLPLSPNYWYLRGEIGGSDRVAPRREFIET